MRRAEQHSAAELAWMITPGDTMAQPPEACPCCGEQTVKPSRGLAGTLSDAAGTASAALGMDVEEPQGRYFACGAVIAGLTREGEKLTRWGMVYPCLNVEMALAIEALQEDCERHRASMKHQGIGAAASAFNRARMLLRSANEAIAQAVAAVEKYKREMGC